MTCMRACRYLGLAPSGLVREDCWTDLVSWVVLQDDVRLGLDWIRCGSNYRQRVRHCGVNATRGWLHLLVGRVSKVVVVLYTVSSI